MKHITAIISYINAGLSSVPVTVADKYPKMLREWKKYMSEMPTSQDVAMWRNYKDESVYGCCLICGAISKNLEVIDIDNHLSNAEQVFNEYSAIEEVNDIIGRYNIPIEKTPSGGYHIFYRCEKIEGNQKLALQQKKAVIETRGEGGLIVCSPTKGYELLQGDLTQIPTITPEERDILIGYAKTFDIPADIITPAPKNSPNDPINHDERPGDIYNDRCIDEAKGLLKSHGWSELSGKHWRRPGKSKGSPSATFGYIAENIFYPFSSNSVPFEERKCYKPFDILVKLSYNGDYSTAAKEVAQRFNMPKKASTPAKTKPQKTVNLPANTEADTRMFWYFGDRGALRVDHFSLTEFLESYGFFRYESSPLNYIFVRIIDNIVEEVCFEQIRDFVLNHIITNHNDPDIYNKINDSDKFKKSKLTLKAVEIEWLKDSIDTGYLYYKNTALKITSSGVYLIAYAALNGKIWRSQILDRKFKTISDDEIEKSDAYRFASIVCANDFARLKAYCSSLGFLMHNYKNPVECPFIYYLDETSSAEPVGGSGKTLGLKMVAKIKKTVFINGKKFDVNDTFALQRVGRDTQLIVIDDMDEGVKFEDYFSLLTTGLPLRRLYKEQEYREFEDSPKFAGTGNYAMRVANTDSFDRRLFEVEIHKYFGKKHTIVDEFKRLPFEGWDFDEWLKFDNFMVFCLQKYLTWALVRPTYVTLQLNKLRAQTSQEFIEWAEKEIIADLRYNKQDLFKKYVDVLRIENDHAARYMTKNKFSNMLKCFGDYKGWLTNLRCGSGGNGVEFASTEDAIITEEVDAQPF